MRESIAYFDNYCPNCGGVIDDTLLSSGFVCERCCPQIDGDLCQELGSRGTLNKLRDICEAEKLSCSFAEFFRSVVGERPWSLQVTWAKRVFMGRSFAIQAPTGIGKTTFGLVMAAFIQGKSYIILPTKLLVQQAYSRLQQMTSKKILAYTGKKREKRAIEYGDYQILVTTNAFLQRNIDLIKPEFDFIFVDDVDSLLKNPRNIDNLFMVMGLKKNDLDRAMDPSTPEDNLDGIRNRIKGVLVVSSATLKPRTKRINLFRRLLGFDIQRSVSTLREVEDLYTFADTWEDACKRSLELIRKIGRGIFVFVSPEMGKEGVEEVVNYLRQQGVSAVSYEEFGKEIEAFKEGKIAVAVGIAISNNALVRGVDLPYSVRAAIFVDVPKFVMPLKVEAEPSRLFLLVRLLAQPFEDERLISYLSYLKRYSTLKAELLDRYPPVKKKIEEIKDYLDKLLHNPDVLRRLYEHEQVFIKDIRGEPHLVIGDAVSYIQASGRTSRLIPGGITKGISVVIAVDKKAFYSLAGRVKYLLPVETVFKPLESVDLDLLLEEVERSRTSALGKRKELFKSVLVVVESPNKARTISNFFGKPQKRWLGPLSCYEIAVGNLYMLVTASVGHVVDLTTKPGFFGVVEEEGIFKPVYSTIKRCSCGNQMVDNLCPKCKTVELDKLTLVEALRRLAFEVDDVYIATDPDAEGEKIAWDLFLALKPYNRRIMRIEFHEVTPAAFRAALEEKREIDLDRVKAQIVRRVADRWVGFTLSQRLQRHFGNRNLSAGRVQTPVLGWVIERDRECKKRKGVLEIYLSGYVLTVEADPEKAKKIYENKEGIEVVVSSEYSDTVSPSPPFTTSDLLKEASLVLKLSTEEAMSIAQRLFEEGYITYHRTDSTRVSSAGMKVARDYIEKRYPGTFKGRRWGDKGAHECIRPTRAIPPDQLRVMTHSGEIEVDEKGIRLYRLIFNRFMASQMKEAEVIKRRLKVVWQGNVLKEAEVITEVKEPGFALLRPLKTVSLKDARIEDVKFKLVPKEHPYTEGTLVEEMKNRGLGRPSTYAKIVQTIINRGYVVVRKGFLRSTPLGVRVYEYLKGFTPYTTEDFTRILESYMDEVEERKRDYMPILRELYSVRGLLQENS